MMSDTRRISRFAKPLRGEQAGNGGKKLLENWNVATATINGIRKNWLENLNLKRRAKKKKKYIKIRKNFNLRIRNGNRKLEKVFFFFIHIKFKLLKKKRGRKWEENLSEKFTRRRNRRENPLCRYEGRGGKLKLLKKKKKKKTKVRKI